MSEFVQKYIHLRCMSVLFGAIWVLLVLGFTYNESIFPKLWDTKFAVMSQITESLKKDSYLFANIGIVFLLIIEVLIEIAVHNHKRNLYKELELLSKHIDTSFVIFALINIFIAVLLYFYCKNNEQPLNQFLFRSYVLVWIIILTYLKYVVFHNPVEVPIKRIKDVNNRTIINL